MIIETKHTANQGPAYLMLGPDVIQFIGGTKPFSEPACIAFDKNAKKVVALGTHAADLVKNEHHFSLLSVTWPLRQESGIHPKTIAELVNRFARKIFCTVVANPVHDLIVTLPREYMNDSVIKVLEPLLKEIFNCHNIRFAFLNDPETGLVSGVEFYEAGIDAANDVRNLEEQKNSMRNIRSIFTRLFIRIAIPVTVVCALIGVLSGDYRLIAGGWAMVIEVSAAYCLHRQNKVLRNYCSGSGSTSIRFWSTRSLVAAVISILVIAVVIAALKHFCGITFVARGTMLGIVFIILVCEWLQCRALIDRATAESRTSSSSKN